MSLTFGQKLHAPVAAGCAVVTAMLLKLVDDVFVVTYETARTRLYSEREVKVRFCTQDVFARIYKTA